jgi:hypothetical protein
MAVLLPPTPVGVPPGHSFWNDWYEKLRQLINTGSVTVLWSNINFSGSNITDIASRAHNNLQSIQGGSAGEYYHLTAAEYAGLGTGAHNDLTSIQGGNSTERYHLTQTQHTRATSFISQTGDPTTGQIAAGEWALYKNTTSGLLKLWANDGGSLKSVTLT